MSVSNSNNFEKSNGDFRLGTLDYIAARNRVDDAAEHTAGLIDFLHREGFVKLEDLHIVGHSLGLVGCGRDLS